MGGETKTIKLLRVNKIQCRLAMYDEPSVMDFAHAYHHK